MIAAKVLVFGASKLKSSTITILLSLALYDNVERLNKTGDDRYNNLMNLKSDKLEIEFVFRTEIDSDKLYKFHIHGKRAKDLTAKSFERKYFKI